jgi:predicted TIM-barrel fold metal-dependent hydrolase
MTVQFKSLANPLMREVGPATPRQVEPFIALDLPPGTVIVSADGHWELDGDIFIDAFPAHLKAEAPRVWFDQFIRVGYRGTLETYPTTPEVVRGVQLNVGPGAADIDVRLDHMSAEGVAKEILFPQSILSFIRHPNPEVTETIFRIYNEYIAEVSARRPGTFFGVGVFANWWDPARAEASMRQIVDLGLKTFVVPINPGKRPSDDTVLNYSDEAMDRFWDVVAEAGLPINFHVGEGSATSVRGGIATRVMTSLAPFRQPLSQLIFGGILDRHPGLKVVFSEGGLSWVAPALQDAEMVFDSYGNGNLFDRIELRPSEYWHRNCYATFQNDLLGLSQLDYLGIDRVMWASDYPHSEGSFGYSRRSIQSVIDAAGSAGAARIVGGNAIELYGL